MRLGTRSRRNRGRSHEERCALSRHYRHSLFASCSRAARRALLASRRSFCCLRYAASFLRQVLAEDLSDFAIRASYTTADGFARVYNLLSTGPKVSHSGSAGAVVEMVRMSGASWGMPMMSPLSARAHECHFEEPCMSVP